MDKFASTEGESVGGHDKSCDDGSSGTVTLLPGSGRSRELSVELSAGFSSTLDEVIHRRKSHRIRT